MSRTQVTSPATSTVTVGAQPARLPQDAWVVITRTGAPQVFGGDQVDHWSHLLTIANVREIWMVENTSVTQAAVAVQLHIAGQITHQAATRVYRA